MQFIGKKDPSNLHIYNTDSYEPLHDGILRTADGTMFKIHRFLLAQRSEYFRALFTSEGNKKTDILIKEIGSQTLRQILRYLYDGALNLNEQNLPEIMTASDDLLLDDLKEKCREYAIRCMTTRDCLPLLIKAARHERLNIFRECSRYAKVHFEEIIKNFPEKIADLPIEVLTELLKDNSLNVASEETVGTAIDIWLKRDPFKRNQYIPDLLNCIRFEEDKPPKNKRPKKAMEISNSYYIESNSFSLADSFHCPSASSYLQKIINRESASRFPKYLNMVVSCPRSLSRMTQAQMYLTCDEELDFWRKFGNALDFIPDVIVPIGRYVYLFNRWKIVGLGYGLLDDSMIPLRGIENREYYCIVELNKKIYILGGYTETVGVTDTVECYNPNSERWKFVAPVGIKFINDAVAMCGRIYALGYTDTMEDLEEADNLDDLLNIDNLDYLGDIDNQNDLLNIDNLDDLGNIDNRNDLLNIDNLDDLGDIDNLDDLDDFNNPHLKMRMRVYDPIINTWNTVESPRVFPLALSSVVFDNRLYLVGVKRNSQSLRCVEEYDPVLNVWKRLPDLPFLYSNPKAQVVAERLLVFDNYHECKCSVFPAVCWDGVTRAWQITDKSFVFYNSLDRHRFVIMDDPVVVKEIVNRDRRSAVQWDRVLLSE